MAAAASAAGRGAVFMDRDGVINADSGYVHRLEDFRFLPGVCEALRLLHAKGWPLVVVTNQSGIARGLYSEAHYNALTAHMQQLLAREQVRLAGVFHCPHHPQGAVSQYRQACECRKPQPGMLKRAAALLGLHLPSSVMVGDQPSDVEAGRAAGAGRCCLIGTPQPEDEPADACYPDLLQFARQQPPQTRALELS
jgi:D-glycero-D-manno-heptose 1,7-bisphosphate phosphatase